MERLIKSMTGYGRGECTGGNVVFSVEIRSVNYRFLETVVRMPRLYAALEDLVKKSVAEKVARGRVDVFVSVETENSKNKTIKVDKDLALAYYNSLKDLGEILGAPEQQIQLIDIARFPDVVVLEEGDPDMEEMAKALQTATEMALEQLVNMRREEGKRLRADLYSRIEKLEGCWVQINDRAPNVVVEYKEKLHARIKELLESVEVDESRLAAEVAFFADRSNITEELVRLQSHFAQFKAALDSAEPIGRKMDFLVQEMNREVNTIGAKANDLTISNLVIVAKSELEKIREQVQNIE
ncbi:YicC/YloC family endoribonuclease [Thermincola ferriacetica]